MKYLVLILAIFFCKIINAEPNKTIIYKGTVGGHSVTLCLQKGESCRNDYAYSGMYSYDGKNNNWILLNIVHNTKGNFCMSEDNFTGVLILTEKDGSLQGVWQSPNGDKSLPVILKESAATPQQIKELNDKYEKIDYERHDC